MLSLALWASTSIAATLTVDASGSSTYTTISSAIAAASNGDIIRVRPGTYSESIDTRNRNLTLRSTGGSAQTTIRAPAADPVITVDGGETVTIEGFTLTGGSHGLYVSGSTVDATDIVVSGVTGAASGGGFRVLAGGNLTVDTCDVSGITLTNNNYGGAIYVYESTASFANCTLSNNHAYQGGAAYLWDSTVEITDSTVDGNEADWKGGGLRIRNNADVTLLRVIVSDNVAGDQGGGLSVEDSDLDARDSELTGNSGGASGGGGTFLGANRNTGTFRGTVSGNTTDGAGGGFYHGGGSFDLRGTLSDNVATDPTARGAGVYSATGDLTLRDLTVSGHSATDGGAVYVEGQSGETLTITDCSFSDNSATGDGGAVYSEAIATLDTVEFLNNSAGGSGGALYVDQAELSVTDGDLRDNTAGLNGGGLMVYKGEATLRRTNFRNNTASRDGGGAFHQGVNVSGTHLTVVSCDFINNSAGQGGGGLSTDAPKRVTLRYNVARGNDPAGVVVNSPSNLVLRRERYTGNVGDGLYASDVPGGELELSEFSENGGDGASFSASGGFTLTNSVFLDNADAGLRVSSSTGGITVANIDANGNATGVALEYGVGADLVNAIAIDNGDGVSMRGASAATVTYCDASGNSDDWAGSLGNLSGTDGNISADPDYSAWSNDGDSSNDLLYLGSTSPCRNAGDPTILDADGSRSDMGSFGGPGASDDDEDGDGYRPSTGDCDEGDETVHPGASDTWYDGEDSDCAGNDDFDRDGDGFPHPDSGEAVTDCDDNASGTYPGAPDTPGDGLDTDCDGLDGEVVDDTGTPADDSQPPDDSGVPGDNDGDGFSEADGDCDDLNPAIHPVQAETCDDGLDNDCDGFADETDAECRTQGKAACACASGGAAGTGWVFLLALALLRRR